MHILNKKQQRRLEEGLLEKAVKKAVGIPKEGAYAVKVQCSDKKNSINATNRLSTRLNNVAGPGAYSMASDHKLGVSIIYTNEETIKKDTIDDFIASERVVQRHAYMEI